MSATSIRMRKEELRWAMLRLRSTLPSSEKQALDLKLNEVLISKIQEFKTKTVHCFIPMDDEPDIKPFIKWLLGNNYKVVCPKTLPQGRMENRQLLSLDNLEKGIKGTYHPKEKTIYSADYDLIFVPGLAFDQKNNRLGYGKGYYDRFLAAHPKAHKIGICYPFQIHTKIPTQSTDIRLNDLIY